MIRWAYDVSLHLRHFCRLLLLAGCIQSLPILFTIDRNVNINGENVNFKTLCKRDLWGDVCCINTPEVKKLIVWFWSKWKFRKKCNSSPDLVSALRTLFNHEQWNPHLARQALQARTAHRTHIALPALQVFTCHYNGFKISRKIKKFMKPESRKFSYWTLVKNSIYFLWNLFW